MKKKIALGFAVATFCIFSVSEAAPYRAVSEPTACVYDGMYEPGRGWISGTYRPVAKQKPRTTPPTESTKTGFDAIAAGKRIKDLEEKISFTRGLLRDFDADNDGPRYNGIKHILEEREAELASLKEAVDAYRRSFGMPEKYSIRRGPTRLPW